MSTEEIIWEFDGGDGRTDVLMALVSQQLRVLEELLPEDQEDPMARLAAEMSERPVELLDSNPVLARLFPAALKDSAEADQFRRDAIGQQARSRLDAGRTVLSDCAVADDEMVGVTLEHLDAWITTLGALRAAWTVELTGSAERTARVTRADMRSNPTAATVCDWLGWVLEDALGAHMLLP
ncbi:MAG: DUF2017 family protein [Propionibacteriaceae bacterium]|nr:DUF2017 family protein [Propionibacteriaceae bacterium]